MVYAYKRVDGVAIELEVYFPKEKSKKPVPGIIFFHGGGWSGDKREAFSYQCDYFASRGLVAADKFLKQPGFIAGELTLAAPSTGEKLFKKP